MDDEVNKIQYGIFSSHMIKLFLMKVCYSKNKLMMQLFFYGG